jgi:hypothetical protein
MTQSQWPVVLFFFIYLLIYFQNSDVLQSNSRVFKLTGWGSGESRKEREGHGMKTVAAVWQEISVNSTSPKYIGRYNISSRHSHYNVSARCFWTGGICWVIYTGQASTYPTPTAFLKYLPNIKIRELDCILQPISVADFGWRTNHVKPLTSNI